MGLLVPPTNATSGTGGWSRQRLESIPELKQQIVEMIEQGLFLSEISVKLKLGCIDKWRKQDKEFDEACAAADSLVADRLEVAAVNRAVDGVQEPVVSHGKVVMDPDTGKPLMMRRYSDGLLQFLLKGRKRELYGDRREIDATVGVNVAGARQTLQEKFAASAALASDEETSET